MEKTGYIKVISSSSLTADFTGSPLQGMDPFNVHFADKSTGKVTLWKWNFGDGETSTHQNPTHRYEKPGLYTVTLTVSGPGGSDTLTRTDYILVTESVKKPVARFETEPMMGRVPLNVQFTDKSMHNPSSYQWDFDDGTHSTLQNPGHTFNRPGIYRTRLTVSNSAGSDSTWRVVIAFPRQWWWW
jgi:PKD repeat protein